MPPARRASRDDGRCSRTTDRDWRARTRKQDYGGRYDRHHLTCDERPANGHKMRRGGRHYNAPRQLFPDGGQDHRYPRSARCRQGGEMPCDRDDRPWANNNNNSNYWKPAQQPAQTPHQPYNAFHPNNYDSYNENGNGCNTPVTWHGYQGGSRQQAHCTPQQQQQQQGWQGPQQQQQQGWQGPQQGWAPQPEPPPHQPQQQQGWQEPQQGWAAQPAPSPHQSQFTPNWPSQHHRPHHQQPQQAYQQQKAYHQQHPPYYQQQPPQQQQPYSWPSNGDSFHGECVTYPNHPHYLNPSRDPRQSAPGRQQEWSQRHVTPVQLQDSDPSQEPDQSFQPEQHWRHHHQEEPQRWPQSCSSSSDRLQQAVASVRPWRLETPAASSDPERCRPEASENTLTAQQLKNLSANAIARYRTNSPPRGSATTPKRSRWDQRRPSTPKKTDACSSGPSSRVDAAPSRPASRTDASSSGPSSRADAAPSRPASRTDASSLGPSSRADATPSRPASRTDATPSKPASRTDASSSGPSSRVDATPSRPASRTDATPSKPASRTDASSSGPSSRVDATPSRPASRTDASSSGPSSRADATPSRPASRTDATPSRPASRTDASNTRPSSRTDPSNTRPSSQTDASNARPGSRTDTVSSESSSRADAATSRSPLPKSSRSASAATEVQPPPSIPDIPQPPSGACSRPPRSDAVLPEPPSGIPDIPQPPSGACSRPPRSDAVLPEPPSGIVMEAGIPLASSTSSRVSGQSEAAGTSKRRKSEADTLPDADPAHVKSKRSSQSSSSKSTPQSSRSSSSKSKKPRSSSHSRSRHKSKRPERSVSAKSSSKKESKTKSLSSSKMSSSTDKQPKEDLGKSSNGNSVLNPPKFNANFRIPKTTKLPNPLLQIKEAPKSAKKTTTTWLQQGSTPKPAAPGSKIHLTPRASEEDNELMNILMGETDVDLAEEVRAARRHKRAGSSCPSKKSERKKTKLKETELVKPSTKTKTHPNSEENAGRSRSSDERPSCKTRSRPTTPKTKRRSRKDSEESEWTPPKRSKSAAKSLCSNSSSEPPSPPQSGIASRTRSRTRSPSSKMPNPVGFSDPYASSDSDDDDDKIIESSWTDETMAHWAKDIGTSEVEKSPPSGLEEVFKRLQRDNRKKKEIVYAQTANYTTLSNCQTSEGSLLASPQMPVLLVEDEISPANRQEMPNITRTPSTGPSIGNLTPSAHSVSSPNERLGMTLVPLEREVPHAITALPQEREGPLASEEIVLDDISEDPDDVEVLGRARCPPSPSLAEFIDLEDQPEIDVHLPIQELWSRLPPSRRHTIETFEDTLKLANSSIVKFVEEFTEAEKIKTRSLREEQFQTLRDEFRAKFSLSYGRTENAFLVLLNYFKEKDLYCILRKRLCCTTDLSDPQSSLDDMRTLIQTVMSSSKLELTRNCSCNVSLAAKLFNMHRTKKEYQTDLNGPVKSTGLRVQGVEPLPLKNQAGESGAKVTESTSNKRPRTPSRDSGYTSPPRVVEPPNEDPVVSDDDSDLFVCIQCKEVATIRCPACPEMFYCSTECQKEHWVTHIETCGYRNLPSPQN